MVVICKGDKMNKLERKHLEHKHKHNATWYGFVQVQAKNPASYHMKKQKQAEQEKLALKGEWK
jgi:hypothetical protein